MLNLTRRNALLTAAVAGAAFGRPQARLVGCVNRGKLFAGMLWLP
jgi:hypothetical protein